MINILEDVGTAFSNLAGRGYDDAILSGYDFCSAVAECVTSGEHLRMMDRTAGQAIFAKEIDRIAVEVGSRLVRVGSTIFGPRIY